MLDVLLSFTVAEKIMAVPKRCWGNALFALRTQKELRGASYVEGWAVFVKPLIIEHGWVELPDRRIVDPSYPLFADRLPASAQPAYFAGVRYARDDLKYIKLASLPCVWTSDGWGGFKRPEYKKAYKEASEYAKLGDLVRLDTAP